MILIIPVEFKKDEKLTDFFDKMDEEKEYLVLLDKDVIKISVELTLQKGWLGFAATRDVTKVLYGEYKQRAKEWLQFVSEKTRNAVTKLVEGNFKKNLVFEVERVKPSTIYIVKGKEFNPYWAVIKPIIGSLNYHFVIL